MLSLKHQQEKIMQNNDFMNRFCYHNKYNAVNGQNWNPESYHRLVHTNLGCLEFTNYNVNLTNIYLNLQMNVSVVSLKMMNKIYS